MRHDPERLAARFLEGQMRRPERWRFERHLVECGECWTQVQQARAGRSAAESLRMVAPARVRERVRAIPELDVDVEPVIHRRRRSTPFLMAAAAVLAALIIGVLTHGGGNRGDEAVAEVAAAYRDATAWAASAAQPPVRQLAGLRWTGTQVTTIDDDRVLGYRYTGGDNASLLVVQRDGAFATPHEAAPATAGEWVTDIDGVTVFCTVLPESVLVVGTEPAVVTKAAHVLTARLE